jgi:hypothetical protein
LKNMRDQALMLFPHRRSGDWQSSARGVKPTAPNACIVRCYGPEVRRKPFGSHLAMDTLPSTRIAARGRRVQLGLYAFPLRGCAGTFTRKRIALLGAQPNPKIDRESNDA